MTRRPLPPNVLDEMIRWWSQQSKPRDSNSRADGTACAEGAEADTERVTARSVLKRRVLYRLMKDFDL